MKISDNLRKLVELQIKTLTQLEDSEKKFNSLLPGLGVTIKSISKTIDVFEIAKVKLSKSVNDNEKQKIAECFSYFYVYFYRENEFVIELKNN